MKQLHFFLVCSFLFFNYSPLQSLNFITDGPIQIMIHSLNHHGLFSSKESISINCEELCTGTGTFKAPAVTITTKKFEFTGIIDCDVSCVITTQEPFDHTIFQQDGMGTFTFIVQP